MVRIRNKEMVDADEGMTNLAGIADEDFKAAGESSAPTEESAPELPDKSFDSDEILDDPATIDVLGEKKDVSHEPGKVTKEIVEVSVPDFSINRLCAGVDGRRKTQAHARLALQNQIHCLLLRQDHL